MSTRFSVCYVSSFYLYLLVILLHFCLSDQQFDEVLCIDGERQALIQFQNGLVDEADRLASWVGEKSDCCKWAGIVCDNRTGHVHEIHLRGADGKCDISYYQTTEEYEEASKKRLRGDLSPSLLELKQLQHLDLSCNDFGGIQLPSFIGSFRNLRYLNLSSSEFGGIIPPQLGNLSELHVLSLGSFLDYSFESTRMMNMQWLSSLHMLHHLDMSGVDLSKASDWLQVINVLPSLVQLHISNTQLPDIHPYVSSFNSTSLSMLDLSKNYFVNSFMPLWIFSITSLVSLDLNGCGFHGIFPSSVGFHNLTSLKLLHVGGNDFVNSPLVLQELSSSVGSNLISLDINHCGVSSSILDSLHNLSSLLSLDLSYNQLTRTIPKSLGNLCNLREIDLSHNNFLNSSLYYLLESLFECELPSLESLSVSFAGISGHLPDQVGKLIRLQHLLLHDNNIVGFIPDSIAQLSFLRTLLLNENLIVGPIPDSIGQLSSLEVLDLSYNQLNNSLPDSIGRLASLKQLDFSYNQLDGSLPNSLGLLSMLKSLEVSNNSLTGVVTEAHFAKLMSLKYIYAAGNNLILRLRVENWIPPFQLQRLYLNSWGLGPQFPLWLQSQRDLRALDISNTHISSPMPPESFWRSFPNLNHLDMSRNHFQGALTLLGVSATLKALDLSSNQFRGNLPNLSNHSLRFLDLSNNHFEGSLCVKINESDFYFVDVSNNHLSGSLEQFLCPNSEKGTQLQILDVANNNLSGVIPDCWLNLQSLSVISLQNNGLSGGIPPSVGSLSSLESFNMRNNKLSGKLPASLFNLKRLIRIELAENEFTGSIPESIGRDITTLRLLSLRSNKLEGEIPEELCRLTSIQILDLSHNNLSGTLPTCFYNFSVMSTSQNLSRYTTYDASYKVQVASLVTKGREYEYSYTLFLVTTLDLSCNKLSGPIPKQLMGLKGLRYMNLSGNGLTGTIPEEIGKMTSLESLDLSVNQFDGRIPWTISSLTSLNWLNLSYNKLTGEVPKSTQLQSLNESSFMGNTLCGPPLAESCNPLSPDEISKAGGGNEEQKDIVESNGEKWGFIISTVLGFILGFWSVVAPLLASQVWRSAYFYFLYRIWFKMRIVVSLSIPFFISLVNR